MPVQTGAGVKVYISDSSEQTTIAGYVALTWKEIEQVDSIGSFGDTTAEVPFTGLGDSRTQKKKGSSDAGNIQISGALDTDALDSSPLGGQGQLLAASADTTSSNYNFRVELNDGASGSPSHGTTFFFAAQVATFTVEISGADSIVMFGSEARINTAILIRPDS